jgi:inhibitor of cysteine peptidase
VCAAALGVWFPGAAAASEGTNVMTLTEADDGRTIELRAGETAQVNLAENATTGYRWAIDRIEGSVEAVGAESHYSKSAVGSGGQATFTLRATKPGSGDVVLKNWREFEGDASVTKRLRLRINVKP